MATPQEIIAGLTQRGLPLHIAQGIAGNMYAESGYNTGINEAAPLVPGSRGGYGLNQWTGPRRRAIETRAQELGVPVSDLGFQLDYTMQELQGPERRAYDALLATTDPVEAARVYSQMFLRPGIPHLDRRLGEAARLAGMDYAPGVMETATRGQNMPDQQGLLAMLGGGQQPQQPQQRAMWDRAPLGLSDPDRRARLALALEGMTLRPNQALMTGLREDVQGRREDARTSQARNATAQWLRSQGRDDLAAVVEGGGLQGAQAMSLAMEDAARTRAGSAPPAAIADVEARANYLGLTGAERDAFVRRELGAGPTQIDPTDDIREYQYAVSQGFGGTFTEYMDQQAASRRPQTNVSVGAGETAFARVAGERAATSLGNIQQTGIDAQRGLSLISDLESNLSAGGSGATAPLRLMAGQFGVVTEGLSELQAAEAIVNRMIPAQREPGSGPMSDRDVQMYARSLPSIANQPGGNALIVRTMRQVLEYDVAAGMIAQSALAGEITPQEANRRMMELADPLAQVRPFMSGAGGASSASQPALAGGAFDFDNPQVGAVLEGYRFLGGDPTQETSWERAQ